MRCMREVIMLLHLLLSMLHIIHHKSLDFKSSERKTDLLRVRITPCSCWCAVQRTQPARRVRGLLFSRGLAGLAFLSASPRSWEGVAASSRQEVEMVPSFLKARLSWHFGEFVLKIVWDFSVVCTFQLCAPPFCCALHKQWQGFPDTSWHTVRPICVGKSTLDKIIKHLKCNVCST